MKKMNVLIFVFLIGVMIFSCKSDDSIIILTDDEVIIPDVEPFIEKTGESLIYDSTRVDNSYVLVNEVTNGRVYIISKEEGEIQYEWNLPATLGNDAELMPNGKLLVALKAEEPYFNVGGYGGRIQIINPDRSIDWDFEYSSENYISHHDVELLPNGNVLILVWEKKNKALAEEIGYQDLQNIEYLLPESLIEVNPTNNEIVWEWHSWNHLIQDFDENKDNYGVVSENPQLININYAPRANGDIMHANGIDYDAVNDIIYLSVNFFNEVWIIDHSTTIQEATSNSGGNFNKGGNLIYRFGNPRAYNNSHGTQLFFNNHFPNILENDEIGSGNMLIYMNGNDGSKQSKIFEFIIPTDFNLISDTDNEPEVFWEFTDSEIYSPILGGAVRLPNGNTLITEPGFGYWEVTNNGEVVWKFKNDLLNWRGYNYSKDYSGIISLGL